MIFDEKQNDKVLMVLESIILTLSLILFINKNIRLSHFISESLSIPYEMAISMFSPGFGYNIVFIFTTIEIILVVLLIEKAIPKLCRILVWGL